MGFVVFHLTAIRVADMSQLHFSEIDNQPADISDRSLLRRVRTGSDDAATEIYLRYADRLLALARANTSADLSPRVDAEDIVQSVFRTFFRRVSKGNYDVPDGEELWKLFLVMGLNKIRTVGAYHRAAKRDVRLASGATEFENRANASDGDEASLNMLKMVIDELLADLTPAQRDIINMRIEGHEVKQIADRMGRSKRSVERILQGFRETLSTQIHQDE